MPWKDQGGQGGGPWGGGQDPRQDRNTERRGEREPWGRQTSSNDESLEDVLNEFKRRFKGMMGGGGGGNSPHQITGKHFVWGALILASIWGATGFYRVNEGETGVVMRFGEMVDATPPGLRYHLPTPIENVVIQKVSAVNRIDGGVRIEANKNGDGTEQSLILTGDENMVLTNYTVLWRIKDVTKFLFTARAPETTIQVAAESVLREVFGITTARQALTEGRDKIGQQAHDILQKLMDEYGLGVEIVSVQLQRVEPPAEVVEAFNDVQASIVDADRFRNEAEAYHNDIVPRARGQAQETMKKAEAYAQEVVAKAEGEAARFVKVADSLSLNRSVLINRLQLDALHDVFAATDKIVLPKGGQSMLPYLPVNEIRRAKASKKESEAKS